MQTSLFFQNGNIRHEIFGNGSIAYRKMPMIDLHTIVFFQIGEIRGIYALYSVAGYGSFPQYTFQTMFAFLGMSLGQIGKTAQKTFVLNIDKTAWKLNDMNDLHFVAFVTTKNGKFNQVVNVVDCKISEPTPFEYK